MRINRITESILEKYVQSKKKDAIDKSETYWMIEIFNISVGD